MARPRKLKSGGDAHEFTREDSAKGGRARAEKLREQREAAEQEARDTLADAVSEAVETLRAGLEAEDANTRIRSAVAILDRAWGRPRQAVEAAVTVTPTVVTPEVDAGTVLAGLEQLGLIQPDPGRTFNGD